MPGWSTQVADVLVQLSLRHGIELDQSQVQQLVYIAHGLRLSSSGDALTGDRPEAWVVGPIFTRLAKMLASVGTEKVGRNNLHPELHREIVQNGLDESELDLIERVVSSYGKLDANELAILTCGPGSPWRQVYAAGSGPRREISHALIKAQFDQIGEQASRHRHVDR